jgi:hypothetical protein
MTAIAAPHQAQAYGEFLSEVQLRSLLPSTFHRFAPFISSFTSPWQIEKDIADDHPAIVAP